MPSTNANYGYDEIVVLVEEYESLNALRATRPGIQIRLMDIDMALHKLSKVHREAVFLCGFLGLTVRSAGKVTGVGKSMMHKRYTRALDALYVIINTGGHYS